MKQFGQDSPYVGSEAKFQVSTATIMALLVKQNPRMMAYHVPNEGKRATKTGEGIKQQGARSGVPDWIITDLDKPWKVAYIELKAKKGKIEDSQIAFMAEAQRKGIPCFVAWNLDGFREALMELGLIKGHFTDKIKF